MEIRQQTQENTSDSDEIIFLLQSKIDNQQQEIEFLQNQVDWFKQHQ